MPVDVEARVIANTRLSPDYDVIALAAPDIATHAATGQFVMVSQDGPRVGASSGKPARPTRGFDAGALHGREREYAIVPFGIAGQPRAVPVETIDDISGACRC